MKKMILILSALLALAGCQKPASQQPTMDQRKDMAHKLILKSLNDLQNKDLKSTFEDLQNSIRVNPEEPEAYLLLGQILLKIQEYDHAVDFMDMTAKTFPNDGTVFYMLSIANRMAGKKLPAVLAARHSFELFQAKQDKDNMLKSAALLHEVIDMPEKPAPAPAAADAAAPSQNTVPPMQGND